MWDEEDWPDDEPSLDEDDEGTFVITCPECGSEMHEDAEICPSCGCFLEESLTSHPMQGRPGWFVILGLLGLLATLAALLCLF